MQRLSYSPSALWPLLLLHSSLNMLNVMQSSIQGSRNTDKLQVAVLAGQAARLVLLGSFASSRTRTTRNA